MPSRAVRAFYSRLAGCNRSAHDARASRGNAGADYGQGTSQPRGRRRGLPQGCAKVAHQARRVEDSDRAQGGGRSLTMKPIVALTKPLTMAAISAVPKPRTASPGKI